MPETEIRDPKSYQRTKLVLGLIGQLIFLLYAGAWLLWPLEVVEQFGQRHWIGLLSFFVIFGGAHELLTLPLSYYAGFVLEHRYGQSNQTIGRWFVQQAKGWALGGVIGGLILCGLYGVLWFSGDLWWLYVWIAQFALMVILAQVFPKVIFPIFHKTERIEDERLSGRLGTLAEGTTLRVEGLYRWDMSEDTKAANAMLAGLGSTRRVYLSDTLLESFKPEEIEIVFAHELGHHIHRHVWKLIGIATALSIFQVSWIYYVLDPYSGSTANWLGAVMQLPLMLIGMTFIDMVLSPIVNAISRHFERQCDWHALKLTNNPEAYRTAFQRLSDMNLADPEPHAWIEWYFHDHPAISKRLAMADRYATSAAAPDA